MDADFFFFGRAAPCLESFRGELRGLAERQLRPTFKFFFSLF